jgi:hypothetical protein
VVPHNPKRQKFLPQHQHARVLTWLWNALGMDKVSVTDDFEELGGDSLIAVTSVRISKKPLR